MHCITFFLQANGPARPEMLIKEQLFSWRLIYYQSPGRSSRYSP
jgi:hypothetical protein